MKEAPKPGKQSPGPLRYAGLGIQLAASILLFVFLGRWLDEKTGMSPLFTLLGAFLGFGGTMWSLIRQLNKDNQDGQTAGRQDGKPKDSE